MSVHRRTLLLCALAASAVAALPAAAGAHHRSPLVEPGRPVHGASPGEWLGRFWETVYETPSPFERYPGCAALGRGVVAPIMPATGGEATCTVAKGTTLALSPDTASCNDYEPPPYFGATPRERRACSVAIEDGVELVEVTVDGVRVRLGRAFRTPAPDGRATLPEDNLLGAPAGTRIRFGADGWIAFTKPLSRGPHEVVLHGAGTYFGEPYDTVGRFHVQAG